MELFDAHQHWDRAGEWKLTCILPPGLMQDSHGTWQTPEGLADRMRRAAILADSRSCGRAVSRFRGQDVTEPTSGPSGALETRTEP